MVKNLKVLHLSSEKTWRGGEQQIAYLIEELSAMGVENHVAVKRASVFENYCRNNQIKYIPLPFENTMDLATAFRIKRYSEKQHVNLIHMHSAKSHGIAVLSSLIGNKTPLILSRRVDFIPKRNPLTRWRYDHPSIKKIIGVSDKITQIMRSYIKDPAKCVTIHSGVDTARFSAITDKTILRKEFNIPADHILIGNTSALEAHKDYPTFIATVEHLLKKQMPVKAFIIGDGSLKDPLMAMVKEKNLQSHIIFTGFRNDVPSILPGLDIFLMPSETEGLGTSLLDAFATGVPVVSTRAGGIPELVEHQKTGMLCNVRDTECLATAIVEVVRDLKLRDDIVKNAKAKVMEFTKRATAEKTLQIYRAVTGGNIE